MEILKLRLRKESVNVVYGSSIDLFTEHQLCNALNLFRYGRHRHCHQQDAV